MVTEQNREAYEELKNAIANNNYIYSFKIIKKNDDFIIAEYELDNGKIINAPLKIVTTENIEDYASDDSIDLDMCYIENFNVKMLYETTIEMFRNKNFYARFSYFAGDVNFSNVQFGDGDIDFSFAKFSDGAVDFRSVQFGKGDVDFSFVRFGCGIIDFKFSQLGDGNVNFNEAMFGDGIVDFYSTQFGKGDVDFSKAKFGVGYVNFKEAKFGNGNVRFIEAQFDDGDVNFNETEFSDGDVLFRSAKFNKGTISFTMTKFGVGNVDFSNVIFGDGNVSFHNAQFGDGNVDFINTLFGDGDIDFNFAKFENVDILFSDAKFSNGTVSFIMTRFGNGSLSFYTVYASNTNIIFSNNQFLNHDNLRFNGIKKLELIDCIIEKSLIIESEGVSFKNIEELSLRDTKNFGKIFIDWDTAKNAIDKYVDDPDKKNKMLCKQKADQMKMLKENYHNLGEYDWEDEAFVEYMRYCRKAETKKRTIFLNKLIDIIGVYGTKPTRVAWWMLGVWAFFGMVFTFSILLGGLASNGDVIPLSEWLQGFYFSAITFLTIGYGDIAPSSWVTQFLAPLEGFLGLFLMSYFTVSVVRKTLR